MKISWLKAINDSDSFKFFKNIGLDVFEIENLEDTDEKIKELVDKEYRTIVISETIAANSADIIKKYKKDEDINIIIIPRKGNLR